MRVLRLLVSTATLIAFASTVSFPARGQSFSSGSTGADGALDLSSGSQTIQVPSGGVFNFTTVNIPAGQTLSFTPYPSTNPPVIMLAQGDVSIAGVIKVSAPLNTPPGTTAPGPGGFNGGDAGNPGVAGWGPGGGPPSPSPTGGHWAGPLSLFPNIGGSGGAGGWYPPGVFCNPYIPGGNGGGAITIASSTLINVSGVGFIDASGSVGASGGTDCGLATLGAPGAVRLVANSVSVTGGVCAAVFRIEAPSGSASYSQGITYCDSYAPPIAPVIATINTQIVPTEPPSLQVVSIGGYAVPPNSGSSFSTIDLLLPYQLQDPIPVVVQATNVPPGSPVTINFSDSSTATFPPANLAGTSSSSTATLYVSGLNRVGIVYLFVSTTFDASQVVMNIHPSDGSAVARVELASALGRRTRYRFLRRDNTEVNPSELPSDLRTLFGL